MTGTFLTRSVGLNAKERQGLQPIGLPQIGLAESLGQDRRAIRIDDVTLEH